MFWECNRCKTRIQVSDTAYLKCEDAVHIARFHEWRFNCGEHHSQEPFQSPSPSTVLYAMNCSAQLQGAASAQWTQKFSLKIKEYASKNCKNWK